MLGDRLPNTQAPNMYRFPPMHTGTVALLVAGAAVPASGQSHQLDKGQSLKPEPPFPGHPLSGTARDREVGKG